MNDLHSKRLAMGISTDEYNRLKKRFEDQASILRRVLSNLKADLSITEHT